ncbi:MAG: NADH-ubiquinone oxidoreductase-F iron-sulfur binding region domain-containing protein [Planctomycetota bacterium]
MQSSIVLPRQALTRRETLDEYRAVGGYEAASKALAMGAEAVLATIESSGLRGHGGAAFPTGRKWALAAATPATSRHVVANGGEHEPGSEKDRYLVAHAPHRVLEGALICAFATGADKVWIYLIEDMHEQIAAMESAIEELRAAGLLERWRSEASFDVTIAIHRAPPTYVAGEETAAIDSIDGGPGKPRRKPPYPGVSGVRGEPTTVNNVETLAHVPWILRHGADAYRAIGTEQSPGSMLVTLPVELRNPGVVEIAYGTTWRELIDGFGGGVASGRAIRAVHPALSAGFLGAEHLDMPIAHETLRPLGSSPGCGGVRLVLEGDDVSARLLEIAEFFMREQCGQCPPCRMETNQFVHVLRAVADGKGGDFAAPLHKVADFARKKGLCSLIEMAAAPILSGVTLFADDLARR